MKPMLRTPAVPAEIQQLIPQYVAGTLSLKETEALEEYCILHPEAAAEIESERLLRAGLVARHRADAPAPAADNSDLTDSTPEVPAHVRWMRAVALAATLAAVLLGVRIFLGQRHDSAALLAAVSDSTVTEVMRPTAHLVLLTLRGQRPVLRIGPADKIASVELQPDPAIPGAGYEISLDRLGDDNWLPLATLPVTADAPSGNLRFSLSMATLHDGPMRVGARPAGKRSAPVYYEFVLSHAAGADR